MWSIEALVVRGLERDGINTEEIVAALRVMYSRLPPALDSSIRDVDLMPGQLPDQHGTLRTNLVK